MNSSIRCFRRQFSAMKKSFSVLHYGINKRRKVFKRRVKIVRKVKAKVEKSVCQNKVEESEGVTPLVEKYWAQRYNLFSRYDQGIKLDEEGWFSVTPEQIAIQQAQRSGGGLVIDCFAGVGGNSIQFASMCCHVVAIDIDPDRVALAYNNAKVYGVENYIDFVVGDFFQLAPSLKGDVAFLSPPWGGPSYTKTRNFTLDLLKPKDGHLLFKAVQEITRNITMFLPRNVDLDQVKQLAWLFSPPLNFRIEKNYVHNYLKGITVYFTD